VVMGYNSTFNSSGNAVKVFVEDDVMVWGGSNVTAQIQSKKDIHAIGWIRSTINMKGLFIAKNINGLTNVNWNKFDFPVSCEMETTPVPEIVEQNKAGEIIPEDLPLVEFVKIKAFPNPFSELLRFEFVSPRSTHARIEIFDIKGRKVKTVFDADVESDVNYNAEFVPTSETSGVYFYRLTLGQEVFDGKVIYK